MKIVSEFLENIEIYKKTIVTTICFTIIIACLTVIYIYTRTPTYPDELVTIDSLCDSNPQRADTMLKRFRSANKSMNSDNEWYCRFIQLKTDVKLLKPQANDKEASAILTHYVSEDDSHMLPQVYYYVGCVYYFLGDSPQAIEYLHKGLSLIPSVSVTEEQRALYYYMLGEILTYQHLDKEALAMTSKSLKIFEKYQNIQRIIYSSLSVSWSLKASGNYEKSIYYLFKAERYALKHNMKNNLSEIYNQLADRYYDLRKYSLAEKYLRLSLLQMDESNKSSIYNVAGKLYEALGNMKKAKSYYGELLKCGTLYSKQNAYNFFVRYYKMNNNLDSLYQSCLQYCATTDSVVQLTASEYSARENALYNYKYVEAEKQDLQLKLEKNNIIIYISAIITLMVIIYMCYYWHRNKKRQRVLDKMLIDANNRNEMVIRQHKIELTDIKNKLNKMTSEKMDIQEKYKQKEYQLEMFLRKNEMQNKLSVSTDLLFKDTKIYMELNEICRHKETISSKAVNWTLLEETLFNTYPTFRDGLMNFKRMKEQAYHVCLLIKAGFNVQEIAFLTMKTDEAINSTRRRLYESNFGKKGKPSEWDDIIRSL